MINIASMKARMLLLRRGDRPQRFTHRNMNIQLPEDRLDETLQALV